MKQIFIGIIIGACIVGIVLGIMRICVAITRCENKRNAANICQDQADAAVHYDRIYERNDPWGHSIKVVVKKLEIAPRLRLHRQASMVNLGQKMILSEQ